MRLYLFLRTRVPTPVALAAGILWLALLLALAVFFATEPQAEFRYGNI